MANTRLGRFSETIAHGEAVRAFVPPPLPPEPPLDLMPLLVRLTEAERALGRLDGIAQLLPAHDLFLYMYVRKEAVLSSQIEGTQSTLVDLLRFESEAVAGVPIDDVREVSNYVDAMMHGLGRMDSLPLSLRLIREMHERLLADGRGANKDPGAFRRTQNWIGGTRPSNALFVPPPVLEMTTALGDLERFLHEDQMGMPPLIKAALIHVQFETIHPFLDGNGRIGRLLVTLYLVKEGVLQQPLLYLSLYLKQHRADYYRLLQEVRETGNWEAWLDFFLIAVAEVATAAFDAATHIVAVFEEDRRTIAQGSLRQASAFQLHDALKRAPYATAQTLKAKTGLAMPTVNAALADLVRLGVIAEVTGKRRGRVFAYRRYLAILSEGTEATV